MKIDVEDFNYLVFRETIVSARHTELYASLEMYGPNLWYIVTTELEPCSSLFSAMRLVEDKDFEKFTRRFVTADFKEAVDYFNYIQGLAEERKLVHIIYT